MDRMTWRSPTSRMLLMAALSLSTACLKEPEKALLGPQSMSDGGGNLVCAPELAAQAVATTPLAVLAETGFSKDQEGEGTCR